MSKLISMTDYVIKKVNENRPCDRGAILQEISDYAKFIKQPLTLGMFIPCDDEGNVLNEMYSEKENTKNKTFTQLSNEYQQAKERVIFEGFNFLGVLNDCYYEIELNNDFWVIFENDKVKINDDGNEFFVYTIEDLIELEFKITETTAKKLGL